MIVDPGNRHDRSDFFFFHIIASIVSESDPAREATQHYFGGSPIEEVEVEELLGCANHDLPIYAMQQMYTRSRHRSAHV